MRLLIGLGNKARHGKDLTAQAIKDYAYSMSLPEVRIYKFAEALYEECRRDHGMMEKDAPLLQRIGTERRVQNPNHWIERVAFKMSGFKGIGLLTDVRYQNEAAWVKSQGGVLINVTRLNEDGTPFVAPDRPADHLSEIDLDDYNWDGYVRTKTGQEALAAEQAITLANFFLEVTRPVNI